MGSNEAATRRSSKRVAARKRRRLDRFDLIGKIMVSPNRPSKIRSASLRRSAGRRDRCRYAARGVCPSAMRLREFHTGIARLRSSASAAANHCGILPQMGGPIQVRTGENIPLLHAPILTGRAPSATADAARVPTRAPAWRSAGGQPSCAWPEIAQPHAAAHAAAGYADFVVPRQREQQEPRMLEGNARRGMQLEVRLVGLGTAVRPTPANRRDSATRAADPRRQQSVHDVQARQLRGLKIELGVPEEKGRLARRLAAMPEHACAS